MRAISNPIDFAREATQLARGLVGVTVAVTTLPLQAYLIVLDHENDMRYSNRPSSRLYNPNKPTPNTKDFPEGLPEERAVKYIKALQKIFLPERR